MNKSMENVSPDKGETLKSLYQTFVTGINSGKATTPKEFLNSLGLDYQKLHLGFNSGQFHHRKEESFKKPFIELGILTKSDAPVREKGMIGYSVFGDYGIIFPLKDKDGNITNFYAHRIKLQTPKGEYLNDEGIYPSFPSKRTTRLFLTENVIDSATMLQSDILENRDSVIALKDGQLTEDIRQAIRELTELEQILVLSTKENKALIKELGKLSIATIQTIVIPESSSLNEFWLTYSSNGIEQLLDEVKPQYLTGFQQVSETEFFYAGKEVTYHIYGTISQNPTLLEMDFVIEPLNGGKVLKERLDLINDNQTHEKVYFWTENTNLNCSQMILELDEIKTALEKTRRNQVKGKTEKGFSNKLDKEAKHLLFSDDLFKQLNDLIGKAGIVGNEQSRLLLYLIASSYKFKYNLHAVVGATDMALGTEFISQIAELLPETEQYLIDLTTSRSFRYYGNSAINNKLVVIPDYSGVTSSRAITDLKRLQSKGNIVNDAPIKGTDGFLSTVKQTVLGHCSSIGACQNVKRHFEGESRTVMVAMDESHEQIQRLMEMDCLQIAGQLNDKEQQKAKELLQYIIRNVHPLEVVNAHAEALMLPTSIKNARILTMQLNCFVSLIALFNQHKRKKNSDGKVIATIEDNQMGIELFLDAILLSVDELDAGTRQFFDKLKVCILNCPTKKETKLSSLDIQKAMNISKSHANRFLSTLIDCEYIKKEGFKNTGFTYTVTHWDELNSIKTQIQNKLGGSCDPNQYGSPEAA